MFETVAPAVPAKSRWLFYETLPVSLALHAIVIGAVVITAIWKVAFPVQSPRVVLAYNLTQLPEPPPPPPPPAAAKAQPAQPQMPAPELKNDEIVAPTVIPDTIPMISQSLPVAVKGVVGGIEGGIEGGVVGGSSEGVTGGEIGGDKAGVIGGILPPDHMVHIERDQPLPMHPVSQVYPQYPEEGRLRRYEDTLVVRYVIGTDGRVKDVIILSHADRKMFDEATVHAIRTWRFRPLIKDGQATEVMHELTVNFRIDPNG